MQTEEVEKSKNHTTVIIAAVVLIAFVVGVVIILINFFAEKTTNISSDEQKIENSSLYCTSQSINISDAFFDLSSAESANQSVKVIFKNKRISDIFYGADIIYNDIETAMTKEAELDSQYGLYMQNNGREMTDFSPNFSVDKTIVKISLFATKEQLNPTFAKIFFINTTNVNLNAYTPEVLAALYKTKGFNCEAKE